MSTRQRPLDEQLLRRLTADPGAWLSCDDCFRLVDVFVEAAVAGGRPDLEMPALANHLDNCRACREEALTLIALAAEDSGADGQAVYARVGLR